MLIVMVVLGVLVFMLARMIIVARSRAKGNNLNTSRGIDDIAAFARALDGGEQPFFPTGPVDQDQVGFGDRREITRRRNESMLIGAHWNQRADLGGVAGHVARDIRQNPVRRHNMQLIAIGKRCAAGQHHADCNKQYPGKFPTHEANSSHLIDTSSHYRGRKCRIQDGNFNEASRFSLCK